MAKPVRLSSIPAYRAIALLLLFPWTTLALSAVLGIDLGTEYIKAVLVKPGIPLEIVPTKDSKRKEIAAVVFKPAHQQQQQQQGAKYPERLYGSDAVVLAARFPSDVYPNLLPLLGQRVGEESAPIERYKRYHPGLAIHGDKERSTVAFRSPALGEAADGSSSSSSSSGVVTVEELVAMQLQNIRANAETFAGQSTPIRDAVITVPAHFTVNEVRALEAAAQLAGLNVVSLISNGLAVGINYAAGRTFPVPSEGGKPETHLIYDMGAGSTTATVVRFQGKVARGAGRQTRNVQEVVVLGSGSDRSLGGDELNGIVVDHMVEEFVKTAQAKEAGIQAESVRAHGRAMAKLWKEAERMRQVLSANTETVASFEGLYEDIDFRYKLSRSTFEQMAKSFAERVQKPLKCALAAAKLTAANLDSIILHGGATRTPFVQARLESFLGDPAKLRSNVNSDEAAVFGAAFRGAALTPGFRVKEIHVRDGTDYNLGLRWTLDGKAHRQKLFASNSTRGIEKTVHFKSLQDFSFSLYHQPESTECSNSIKNDVVPISSTQTTNLTASVAELTEKHGCVTSNISTSFVFRLSPRTGLPEVVQGAVSCVLDRGDKKGGVVDDVKGFFGFGSKHDEQKPIQESTVAFSGTESPSSETGSTTGTSASQSTSTTTTTTSTTAGAKADASAAAKKKAQEAKPRTARILVGFTTTTEGVPELPGTELSRMKSRLGALDASDQARRQREESLNALEAYVYRARDLLTDEAFAAACKEADRERLAAKLEAASEWLYDQGADAARDELRARQKELTGLVDPVLRRLDEAGKRPKAVDALRELLSQTRMLSDVLKENIASAEKAAAAVAASSSFSSSSSSAQADSASASSTAATSTGDAATKESATSSSTSGASVGSSSSSSSTVSSSPSPSASPPPPEPPLYTPEDLSALTSAADAAERWLSAKLAEQDKRAPHDNPAVLASEIEEKKAELTATLMKIVRKPPPPKPKSSSSSAKAKTKAKSKSTAQAKSGQESSSSSTSSDRSGGSAGASTATAATSQPVESAKSKKGGDDERKHDEL